jgi:CelD/BcsL family acetyltransferase involved in cellulose biosynthesis
MNIATLRACELSNEQVSAWSDIQRANPRFASPYFRPEFTQVVASVRPGIEVAMISQGGEPIGFLPFGRTAWNTGIPVAARLCDFQGVVVRPNVSYDPLELVRACDLSSWRYTHLVTAQPKFIQHCWKLAESPYADLSQGFDVYQSTLSARTPSELRRKRQRMESEMGAVRFEPYVDDPQILRLLFDWKSQQYRRTAKLDVLGYPWVRRLLQKIACYRSEDFAGMVSALRAGDQVAAVSYVLRSRHVMHYWFAAYDPQFARYSPGRQLLWELLRHAAEQGVRRFDLGKGPEEYKRSFASGATIVAEGAVDRSRAKAGLRRAIHMLRHCLRATPLQSKLQLTGHAIYKLRGRLELQ